MGLPYFFQKFQFDLIILGLPGTGKKLFLENKNTQFKIQREIFLVQISSPDNNTLTDYTNWINILTERNLLNIQNKKIVNDRFELEFKNRKYLDEFLELILLKNGGVSLNSALPEGLAWNPEKFPPAIIVNEEDFRFKMETSKGKWLVSFKFSPGSIKNTIHYPEDKIKMLEFCKKHNLETYDVPFFENQIELSYQNWDKLAEALLN